MKTKRKKPRNPPKYPLDHEPIAITYARKQAGLTKTALAEMCGVSLSLISEIESGTRNATPAMLNKLAEALNCPRVVLERKRDEVRGEHVHGNSAPTSPIGGTS
jgi:transcriptional regulator with XRE-family HTH domain